jgi:hypothetical protein
MSILCVPAALFAIPALLVALALLESRLLSPGEDASNRRKFGAGSATRACPPTGGSGSSANPDRSLHSGITGKGAPMASAAWDSTSSSFRWTEMIPSHDEGRRRRGSALATEVRGLPSSSSGRCRINGEVAGLRIWQRVATRPHSS